MRRLDHLLIAVLVVLACAAPARASSLTYLPHLSNHDPAWANTLAIDSFDDAGAQVYLALYKDGAQVFGGSYALRARETLDLDLDVAGPAAADCGYVLVHSDNSVVHEGFRSLLPGGGGVADFILPGTLSRRLAFVFPAAAAFVTWKGLALTNAGDQTAAVTLTAWGPGGDTAAPLGTASLVLGPWEHASGVHSVWFPAVGLADLVKIEARADSGALAGIVISGDAAAGKLFFTPAVILPEVQP